MATAASSDQPERPLYTGQPAVIYDLKQLGWACLTMGAALVLYWLRSITTKVELTSQRLRITSGILSKVTQQVELTRIDDVTVEEPISMRLLGFGLVRLRSTDRSTPEVLLAGIKAADLAGIGEQVRECSHRKRDRRRVAVVAHA